MKGSAVSIQLAMEVFDNARMRPYSFQETFTENPGFPCATGRSWLIKPAGFNRPLQTPEREMSHEESLKKAVHQNSR